MAINVEVPGMGESVNEATLLRWHKQDGEYVKQDEPLAEMETDKANVDVPAPSAGVIKRITGEGTKVKIGDVIATIDTAAKPAEKTKVADKTPAAATQQITPPSSGGQQSPPSLASHPAASAASSDGKDESLSPAVKRMVAEHNLKPSDIPGTGKGGRITKEDVVNFLDTKPADKQPATAVDPPKTKPQPVSEPQESREGETRSEDGTRRVPMSKIRKRIAENLVRAKQTAAILTTFNEVDMSAVMELRSKYKERFEKQHQIGLGFMSFFAKACCQALREFERVNGSIDGDDVIYHDYVHLGIAVSTERGLAVPVLRNAHELSFAKIESEIKRLAIATREGKLGLNELSGGTFTITNGGIFGSMLSTPILNPPQSAILGMHNIVKRPVVVNNEIVIRPMMYLALSYDHRLIDGRESVTFLVRVKELLEDPTRLMLEV